MMDTIKGWFHTETPEEAMKKYKRSLDRTVKDLERERTKLVQQEKKITIEMKKMAKQDQIESVRIMAKDLVRTRKFAQKMYRMKTQIQGVSLRIQTMQATNQMAKAMAGVGKAMGKMNQKMNIPQMQAIMREFEKQNEMMGMKEEMMNDAVDEIMDDDDLEEEETELEINKVMDEIGLEFKSKVGVTDAELPSKQQQKVDETADGEEDKELMDKYAALKQSMK